MTPLFSSFILFQQFAGIKSQSSDISNAPNDCADSGESGLSHIWHTAIALRLCKYCFSFSLSMVKSHLNQLYVSLILPSNKSVGQARVVCVYADTAAWLMHSNDVASPWLSASQLGSDGLDSHSDNRRHKIKRSIRKWLIGDIWSIP